VPEGETDPVDAFLQLFGATGDQDAAFRDPTGQRIAIGSDMFASPEGQGQIPLTLAGTAAGRYHPHPDEIWAQIVWLPEEQQSLVRRYYLARLQQEGEADPLSVVFATAAMAGPGIFQLTIRCCSPAPGYPPVVAGGLTMSGVTLTFCSGGAERTVGCPAK
jgi:hypothetical protein